MPFYTITFNSNKYNLVVNGLFLPVTILVISGGIKITKSWYFEQKENERLAKEKINGELQLLKNQLRPRFLFYSLNTIKRNILLHPGLAANLILKLSELLSYLLYESDRQWIALEKELEIIKSYAEFQKRIRRSKFDTEIGVSGITSGKYTVPLLLLSFIESSFDFILKENQKHLSLKLFITVGDDYLDYNMIFNRFLNKLDGVSIVKMHFFTIEKQLRLTYPNTYKFTININDQDMAININLPLHLANLEEDNIVKEKLYELL